MTVLTSDFLLWLMFIISMFLLFKLKDSPSFSIWLDIFKSKLAMSSFVILIYFVTIALLDSVHWYSDQGKILSLLDLGFSHLNNNIEKTYTAPFEIFFNTGESVLLSLLSGLFAIIFFWGASWLKLQFFLEQIKLNMFKDVAGKTFLITNLICLLIIFISYELSHFTHILGTDKVGQDIYFQAMKSIRTGLLIGTLTTVITLPLGIFLGLSAGYFGGKIDDLIQYIYTVLNSIPGVLLIASFFLVISAQTNFIDNNILKADIKLLGLCFILGITSWTGLCRLLRAETLKIRELGYVKASQILGTSHFKIIIKHILPNTMHLVLITLVMDFSGLVLAEAVLSYIGIGVDPSINSWGNMINSARLEFSREPIVWWNLMSAFIFMLPLVLATNLFAEVVREKFEIH